MKLIHVLPTTLAALLALAVGCPPGDACPTGSSPTPDGRCVLTEPEDAGVDARTLDVTAVPTDAFAPDAFSRDAFLVIPDGCIPVEYWNDNDADGFGDMAMASIRACVAPAGYVTNNTDCNDACAACHPGGTEVCDALDNNCNGTVDEGVETTYYRDADGDGHGDSATSTSACAAPVGFVASSDDCDDARTSTHPGAAEVCNGNDDNCAAGIDEGLLVTLYRDTDSDAYGTAESMSLCPGTAGWVGATGDCNDGDPAVNPGRAEACNGIDDNCAAGIDEGLLVTLYRDGDSDTYGAGTSMLLCPGTAGWVSRAGDCDDASAAVNPGRVEVCNGIDDNCAAGIDEGLLVTLYRDGDSDTYGSATNSLLCPGTSGWVNRSGDCDDASAAVNPGRVEVCNGIDDNCAAGIDEGLLVTLYRDGDSDSYGAGTSMLLCPGTAGWVNRGGDCNDMSAAVNPGRVEVCNGIDDNCAAGIDEGLLVTLYTDADADTYGTGAGVVGCPAAGRSAVSGDCNDMVMSIHPGATELCNSIDDNCNVLIDESLVTWGSPTSRGLSTHRVEMVQTATEAFAVTARTTGVYAQRFSSTGTAGAEVLLRAIEPLEFGAAIYGTTLYVASYEGSTVYGMRYSTVDLSPIGSPVIIGTIGEFSSNIRVVAGASNVGVIFSNGVSLTYLRTNTSWGSPGSTNLGNPALNYDVAAVSGTRVLLVRNSTSGPIVQGLQLNGTFEGNLWAASTTNASQHAQIVAMQSESGSPVVAVLYHHDPAASGDEVRLALLDVGGTGALTFRSQISLMAGTPFATPLESAMALSASGRNLVASWLTSTGTVWNYADVRVPASGAPTLIGAAGSVSLGTATTSMDVVGFPAGPAAWAIHGRATAVARTWFRGCP